MSTMSIRRGVTATLGAAAGVLAAAALLGTAPIASADDGADANGVDYAALASPAASFPELTYTNEFLDYTGTSGTEYVTTYTGTGAPTTVTEALTVPTGETEYGSYDYFSGDYFTTASTGYSFTDLYEGIFGANAAGPFDTIEPFVSTFSSF